VVVSLTVLAETPNSAASSAWVTPPTPSLYRRRMWRIFASVSLRLPAGAGRYSSSWLTVPLTSWSISEASQGQGGR
jgi:hypothetical protein